MPDADTCEEGYPRGDGELEGGPHHAFVCHSLRVERGIKMYFLRIWAHEPALDFESLQSA